MWLDLPQMKYLNTVETFFYIKKKKKKKLILM